MPLDARPYGRVAAGPIRSFVRPIFDPNSPFVERPQNNRVRDENDDTLEVLRPEYTLPPPRQGLAMGLAAGRIRHDDSPISVRTLAAAPPRVAVVLQPWARCPTLTVEYGRWREEMCLIGHEPLLALTHRKLVAVQNHHALHIFEYENLKTWLHVSSGIDRRALTFKNPANGVWTPLSHLYRVMLLDEAGAPLPMHTPQ